MLDTDSESVNARSSKSLNRCVSFIPQTSHGAARQTRCLATPKAKMAHPRGLVFKRLLTEDRDARLVVALAEDGEQQPAVVILSKPPFQESHVQEILSGDFASTEEHRNDKFSKHSLDVPARLNGIMATMICPANEVDVAKYTHQVKHFVRETAALYSAATEPFVRALPPKQLAWVWNILDHEKEVESIIDETEHYVMVPDTKWDQACNWHPHKAATQCCAPAAVSTTTQSEYCTPAAL